MKQFATALFAPLLLSVTFTVQAQVFTDQIAASGLPSSQGNVAAIYDHDNDGLLDLIWGSGDPLQYRLMRNNGDLTFSDISAASGFVQGEGFPVDIDNNGWTDLIYGNWEANLITLRLNNGGTFTTHEIQVPVDLAGEVYELTILDLDQDGAIDILSAVAVNDQIHLMVGYNDVCTMGPDSAFLNWTTIAGPFQEQLWPSVFDYDNDGDQDLLVVHLTNVSSPGPGYHYQPIKIYRNDGGTFSDVTAGSGLGMGHGLPTLWDYNNDGYLDLVFGDADCCDQPRMNRVYRNNGNSTFTDLGGSLGLSSGATYYFPPTIFDVDNDGDEDLLWDIWSDAYNLQLYINSSGTFGSNEASSYGLDLSNENPFAFDVDNDGDVDLICGSHGEFPEPAKLMVNPLLPNATGTAHYLNIVLNGCASGHSAINALVRVYHQGNVLAKRARPGLRLGYDPSAPDHLNFGLGTTTQADSVVVFWPSGMITRMYQVPSGQLLIQEDPGCIFTSCLTTAIGVSEKWNSSSAYPNPTTGPVRLTNIPHGTTPQLYDATGRNLLITTQRKGQDAIFDLGTYPAGLYFIRAGERSFTIVRE